MAPVARRLGPHLYCLGYLGYPGRVNVSLCRCRISTTVYINDPELSRGGRQRGWTSCLASEGKVTLGGGTTFLHINTLARLAGTTLGLANVTKCLD